MAKIKTEAEYAVETATEFTKLDLITQQAFQLAAEMLKRVEETKEAEKEEKKNEESD